jgi:putative inorganic carbon (HCO3(-)) transporter
MREAARQKLQPRNRLAGYFERIFIHEKLNNVPGFLLIGLVAVGFGYLIATKTLMGMGLFAAVVAFFVIIACMLNTELGLYINIFYSFFAFGFARFLYPMVIQVGIVTDILILSTFMSLIIRRTNLRKSINEFARTPVVIAVLLYVFFLFIELFNPYAHSFEGWFQTFRRFFGSVFILFFSYNVFTSYAKIRRFVIVLFTLCTITGMYGCLQQWHGYFDFEMQWLLSDPHGFALINIHGELRKISTMSDPTAYGILMAACSVFFIILAVNQKKWVNTALLLAGTFFMLLGMAYSGTRTANAVLVSGLAVYILLRFDHKGTRIFAIVATFVFLGLLYAPIYGNTTLNRFRSSFAGKEDASFNVREVNRKFIQPYIHRHPIGGGIGTAGAQGLRFNPGHYLAGFPPDSGYLKKALETGWIGLMFICILYFITLRYGVKHYFRAKNKRYRILYAATISSIFAFYLAEFPQEAIGQITDIVVYYPWIAMMLRMKDLERRKDLENDDEVDSTEEEYAREQSAETEPRLLES